MFLTVGMACYKDFDGVFFSTMDLILHHSQQLQDGEILIVDNSPNTKDGEAVRQFVGSCRGGPIPVRYIGMEAPIGTSPARDMIFKHARGEYVLVMDCHVLFFPLALWYLREYLERTHPNRNLIQGVLWSENFLNYWTHFQDVWRYEMWGIWGTDERGRDPTNPPFEIPAQGLGVFCSRREDWLGFHPQARGFGGEECYIHEKYRKAGRTTYCVPGLRWIHRFYRPHGVPYPLTQWHKVRNYVLEHLELGLPLDRIYRHFVLGDPEIPPNGEPAMGPLNRMSQRAWDYLVADPVNHLDPPKMQAQ